MSVLLQYHTLKHAEMQKQSRPQRASVLNSKHVQTQDGAVQQEELAATTQRTR